MTLHNLLLRRIDAEGSISLAEYMMLALCHPQYGYYTTREPFGVSGDFTTAPEISQIFGEILGAWCAERWSSGGGGEMSLVELGPGRGTLMKDMLRATRHVPGFHDALSVHLVEISPRLRQLQQRALSGMHPSTHWHETWGSIPKDRPWLLVANEFLDALPIRQFFTRKNQVYERHVAQSSGKLCFVDVPAAGQAAGEDGQVVETCAPAQAIISMISSHIALKGGAALFIDYGYTEDISGDTLQAVKHHAYHPVLEAPGEADLTAHVNFHLLRRCAEAAGAQAFVTTQGEYLLRLGAGLRAEMLQKQHGNFAHNAISSGLARLVLPDQMGRLFKVMAITKHKEPPPGFE